MVLRTRVPQPSAVNGGLLRYSRHRREVGTSLGVLLKHCGSVGAGAVIGLAVFALPPLC